MKLNVGCGAFYADGWVNTDVFEDSRIKPDYLVPTTGKYPFDDSTFDAVYMGHVLEHIPWDAVPGFLNEMSRIANHDAVFMIVGPDSFRALDMWKQGELSIEMVSSILEHQDLNYQDIDPDSLRDGAPHMWNCHEKRVAKLLTHLGFCNVKSEFETLLVNSEECEGISWPLVSGVQWQFAISCRNTKRDHPQAVPLGE